MTDRQAVEHRWLSMGLLAKLTYSVCFSDVIIRTFTKFFFQTGLREMKTTYYFAFFLHLF